MCASTNYSCLVLLTSLGAGQAETKDHAGISPASYLIVIIFIVSVRALPALTRRWLARGIRHRHAHTAAIVLLPYLEFYKAPPGVGTYNAARPPRAVAGHT